MTEGNGPLQVVCAVPWDRTSRAWPSCSQVLAGLGLPWLHSFCWEVWGRVGQAATLKQDHSISRMRSSPSSVMSLVT